MACEDRAERGDGQGAARLRNRVTAPQATPNWVRSTLFWAMEVVICRMRARFGSRLTRRRVMTQARLADTLAGCVNQQVNQALPGSITGGTTLCAGFDDGEVTASPGMMPLRAGLPDRTVPSGLLSA